MDLNSDLRPFNDFGNAPAHGASSENILKNYRLDINFDRDRITNLDNRSGISGNAESSNRQGGPPMQPFDNAPGFYNEPAGAGGNVAEGAHQEPTEHQMQMMQQQQEMEQVFQQQNGVPANQAFQRASGVAGSTYGNNQSTILEEAASNEEDADQALGDNESMDRNYS